MKAPSGAYQCHDAIISDFSETVASIICKYTDGTYKAHSDSHVVIQCIAPAPKENLENELKNNSDKILEAIKYGYKNNAVDEHRSGLRTAQFLVSIFGHQTAGNTDNVWADNLFEELRPYISGLYKPNRRLDGIE